MNTIVRTLPQSATQIYPRQHSSIPSKPSFGTLLLAIIVLASALAVVYMTDLNRRVFMQLQTMQNTRIQLELDWGKLLLEQSTWSTQSRIQSLAQEQLGMVSPATNNVVMVTI